jgi:hypothetical protein
MGSKDPMARLRAVRITRDDVVRCNDHTANGAVLGCPMCFLRAEYAFLEFARRYPDEYMSVLQASSQSIKEQILRQESEP